MAEIGSAFLSILPSAKGFGSKLESEVGGESKGAGKKLGSGFGTAFKVGAAAVVGTGLVAATFLKGAVSDAREAQKVAAATTAIIKATGGAAKLSAAQVADLSGALAAKTGVDDGQIAAGANLLLTFKNVRKEGEGVNDIFKRATVAGLDLAAAGFGSVEGNAVLLGKALNDPIKGLASLGKNGVTFTEQQKKQIKALVGTNDLLGAQKVILKEVEAQVGGTAAATATAGEKASYAYGELKESIGTALLPVIDRLQNAFVALAPKIQGAIDGVGPAFTRIAKVVKPFADAIQSQVVARFEALKGVLTFLQPAFDKVATFFRNNPGTVKVFAVALASLVGIIGAITLATTLFSIALNSTGIPLVIIGIAALAAGLYYAYQRSETFRNIVNQVGAGLREFAAFVTTQLVPVVLSMARTVGEKARPVIQQLGRTFQTQVVPTITKAVAKFREMQPTIQRVVAVVVKVIAKLIVFYSTVLSKVLPVIIRFAGFILGKAVLAVVAYIAIVVKIIGKMVDFGRKVAAAGTKIAQFASKAKAKFTEVVSLVQGIPGKVSSALGDLYNIGKNAAARLGQGVVDGITGKIRDVKNAVGNMASAIKDHFPGSPVKKGPLKSWNRGSKQTAAARKLAQSIADGLKEKKQKVVDAARAIADGIRSQISSLKDDMRGLSQSVADAFKPDLLSGNLSDLFSNGAAGVLNIKNMKKAFLKLRKFGLGESFLSDLFASGNSGLIAQLASGTKKDARSAQYLYGQNNLLANQLGNAVAKNEFGDNLDHLGDRLERALTRLERAVKRTPESFAKELNGAARNGRRKVRA